MSDMKRREFITLLGGAIVIVDNLTNLLCFFRLTVLGKIDDLRGHDSLPFREFSKRRRWSLCLCSFLRTIAPALRFLIGKPPLC